MKYVLIALGAVLLLGAGYYIYSSVSTTSVENDLPESPDITDPTIDPGDDSSATDGGDSDQMTTERGGESVLGTSAGGHNITAHHFGSGDREVLFVGGTHGGYSFNTAALGFELVDYFTDSPDVIPDNVMVTVIPVLNPDGLTETVGSTGRFNPSSVTSNDTERVAGRFNANGVDLNRNFDCKWQAEGTWRTRTVDAGSAPFSEPETAALRDYIAQYQPTAAVVYYSQAGGVYSATCNDTISTDTAALTNTYADAAGYPAYEEFDYYEVTGDMVNWMTSEGMAAISVLLSNHENTEWTKNRAGVNAVLDRYAQ